MRNYLIFIFILPYLLCVNTASISNIHESDEILDEFLVNTTTGFVRGGYGGRTVGQNKSLFWFRGIPYAEPPIGDLRFEPPIPKKRWDGILDAAENGPECIQGSNPTTGSEDCLYIKIWTTKLPKKVKEKRPVMVYIHGGMFLQGSPNFSEQSPDFLLDEDVIVAAFHYRLGIFGFLTTGDMVVPGNNGLKDQVSALRWIKDNIEAFGGDPDNITIFGQSAGGVSVSYLLQTNHTKGLFNRAIMHSGVTLCLWAYFRGGVELTKKMASNLGIDISSSESIVKGLKSIEAVKLQETQSSSFKSMLLISDPRDGMMLGPVIEPDHEGALFSKKSYDVLKRGKFNHVPLIVGHTSLEAYLSQFPDLLRIWLLNYDINYSKLVPTDINVKNDSLLREIGGKIKNEYFGTTHISLSNRQFMEFISDDQFERPIQETVRLYSEEVPVYYYRFSYEGALWGIMNRTWSGVGHTEDLGYIFDFKYAGSEKDYLTRARMVKLWTNFAKTGNPTPEVDIILQNITWTPNTADSDKLHCLDIDSDLRMIENPNKNRMKFWRDLYDTYAVPPFDTF